MFNTTNYKTESKVVAVTKEIEKTISPDKVTDMYDRVRDEVVNSIVRSYTIEDNSMKCAVVEYNDDMNTTIRRYIARYTLNGDEHLIEGSLLREDLLAKPDSIIMRVYDHYCDRVASQIIQQQPEIHERLAQ